MKKFLNFWKKNWRTVCLTIFVVGLILLVPIIVNEKNPVHNVRWWFFTALASYLIIGGVLAKRINEETIFGFLGKFMNVLKWINFYILIILSLGFLFHYSDFFPTIINDIFAGWPGFVSFVVFFIIVCVGAFVLSDAKEEAEAIED